MSDESGDDPIIHRIPVYLTKEPANNLYLIQYPLRPSHMPYDSGSVVETKFKEKSNQLELVLSLNTRAHFSRSKGEQFVRGLDPEDYRSGLMDKVTLTSSGDSKDGSPTCNYAIGVYDGDQLHLSPLQNVIKLRPSLKHIELKKDQPNIGSTSGNVSDGNTTATESEDEAKPITVKFTRGVKGNKFQNEPEEPWKVLTYHQLESSESTQERSLLFSTTNDNQMQSLSMSPKDYLNIVCPILTTQESEGPSHQNGALSLTQLKLLPFERQVVELMKKAVVLQFDHVCTMLGKARTDRNQVLQEIQKCSLLVQGCWVVNSALLYNREKTHLRNARDFILWCFTQNALLTRKDLTSMLKITNGQLRELLAPIASLQTGGGWKFRNELDNDFILKYPQIVMTQQEQWSRKHRELVNTYGITPTDVSSHKGCQESSGPAVKSKVKVEGAVSARPRPSSEGDVIFMDNLQEFCKKTVGVGVVSLNEMRDHLLKHQETTVDGDPLNRRPVSDETMERALNGIGCVRVGRPLNKQLYAIEHIGHASDIYRSVILELFQTAKSIKRKQLNEVILERFGCEDKSKLVTVALKDLCTSRGASWYLKGSVEFLNKK